MGEPTLRPLGCRVVTPPATKPVRRLEETIEIAAAPAQVFAWLDNPRNTGWHMSRPSLAMLGGSLRVERLSAMAAGVGATYRSWGRVLGLRIDFTTIVVRWVADREKVWRTIGNPRLIVIGPFEMRFGVEPVVGGARLTMALEYELPSRGLGRLLGRALAAPYAKWCLRRMCRDARAALGADGSAVRRSGAE
jgi:Polyketide cyclase / dehydrase and lipid transport